MLKRFVVMQGRGALGPFRLWVERREGENDTMLIHDMRVPGGKIVAQYDTKAEADAAVDSWADNAERAK